jgi:hypothetical protein
MDIIFPNLNSINTDLRELMAQIKRTPFLPIHNELLAKLAFRSSSSMDERVQVDFALVEKFRAEIDRLSLDNEYISGIGDSYKQVIETALTNNSLFDNRLLAILENWYQNQSANLENASDDAKQE